MGIKYSELLKHPKWQKKRLEIMNRANFKCEICQEDNVCLNIHHKEYIYGRKPWEYSNDNLICLCENCHKDVHSNKIIIKRITIIEQFFITAKEFKQDIKKMKENNDPNIDKIKKDYVNRLKKDRNKVKRQKLLHEICEAEKNNDSDKLNELKNKFNKLVKQ